MNNTAKKYKEQLLETVGDARDKLVVVSKDMGKKLDKEARKKPWLFVAIASAFSAIFGIFLGRKFKKKDGV